MAGSRASIARSTTAVGRRAAATELDQRLRTLEIHSPQAVGPHLDQAGRSRAALGAWISDCVRAAGTPPRNPILGQRPLILTLRTGRSEPREARSEASELCRQDRRPKRPLQDPVSDALPRLARCKARKLCWCVDPRCSGDLATRRAHLIRPGLPGPDPNVSSRYGARYLAEILSGGVHSGCRVTSELKRRRSVKPALR